MKAAAGKDGITVKMVNRKVFDELWWELFNCGGGVVWFHLCGRVAWSCQCQFKITCNSVSKAGGMVVGLSVIF